MGRQLLLWFGAALLGGVLMLAIGSHFGLASLPQGIDTLWRDATPDAAAVQQRMQATPPTRHGVTVLRTGDRVPEDFGLPDLDGHPQTLAAYRGRLVLINFWATWCAPCREEMPALADAQRRHPHMRIIGIALDTPDAVRQWLKHTPVPYPIWQGLADKHQDPAMLFNDTRGLLPYSVLIDAKGRIRDSHLGKLDTTRLQAWLSTPVTRDAE